MKWAPSYMPNGVRLWEILMCISTNFSARATGREAHFQGVAIVLFLKEVGLKEDVMVQMKRIVVYSPVFNCKALNK